MRNPVVMVPTSPNPGNPSTIVTFFGLFLSLIRSGMVPLLFVLGCILLLYFSLS